MAAEFMEVENFVVFFLEEFGRITILFKIFHDFLKGSFKIDGDSNPKLMV